MVCSMYGGIIQETATERDRFALADNTPAQSYCTEVFEFRQ
jgi:hypothetical protein